MEDSKYYTPYVEEFHQGFDYEIEITKWTNGGKEKEWQQLTYNISYNLPYGTTCRVKYLDKEDIESLGWKEGTFKLKTRTLDIFGFKDYIITSISTNHIIDISLMSELEPVLTRVFRGTIKNKSELKKLMKQLGIYEQYNK